MYPSLRIDHLRHLEKCGVVSPVVIDSDRCFGFSDLTILRQIASDLERGAPFRAVARTLQSSRHGQLAFDFDVQGEPARVIELEPRRSPAQGRTEIGPAEQYFLMGSLLDDGTPERTEQAVGAYRRALELDPDLVPALINLANIRYARQELPEAIALYERAILLDDTYFEAHFNLGNINHDLGRYPEAEACYRRALALNYHYADAHFYLAVTLDRMGRALDAAAHWKAYERLSPDGTPIEPAAEPTTPTQE